MGRFLRSIPMIELAIHRNYCKLHLAKCLTTVWGEHKEIFQNCTTTPIIRLAIHRDQTPKIQHTVNNSDSTFNGWNLEHFNNPASKSQFFKTWLGSTWKARIARCTWFQIGQQPYTIDRQIWPIDEIWNREHLDEVEWFSMETRNNTDKWQIDRHVSYKRNFGNSNPQLIILQAQSEKTDLRGSELKVFRHKIGVQADFQRKGAIKSTLFSNPGTGTTWELLNRGRRRR